jgi:hypothetical protein
MAFFWAFYQHFGIHFWDKKNSFSMDLPKERANGPSEEIFRWTYQWTF